MTDVRLTHIGGPTVADRGRRLAAAHRPDVRPARPAGTASAGGRRRASSPGPAIAAADLGPIDAVLLTPRPPRRQPRRRRAGAAARRRASSSPPSSGAGAARRQRARARAVGDHAARGAGPADDRGHRDAVPPRPAAEPPDRRRRDRLRARAGTARSTACCGSRATPCSTTACARSPTGCEVDTALLHLGGVRFPVTGPLRYTMTAQRRRRAVRADRARARRSRSTTRAGRTSARGARRSSASSRARRRTSASASAGCRSARPSMSRTGRRIRRCCEETSGPEVVR